MGGAGSGGHNRKSTRAKELEGNAGKRALNHDEPKPEEGTPQIPIRLPALARSHWNRLVPILKKMKVLTVADGDALAGYCTVLVRWELATAAIEKYGIIIAEPDYMYDMLGNGGPPVPTGAVTLKVNAAVRIQSDALRQMRAFESAFGLDPASRGKLHVSPEGDAPDSLDAFLSGGKGSDDVVM
jgi:P27 family predicted phage terminase small subunit